MGAKAMYDSTGNLMDASLEGLEVLVENFTGFGIKGPQAGQFFPQRVITTYAELAAGTAGHMLANKFGVNRQIAKVPFLGKHIQL